LTQGVEAVFYRAIVRFEDKTMLDMTQMLRPFFWVMVGLTVLAPVAIAFARRGRNQSV
jgi:hypothetical protein